MKVFRNYKFRKTGIQKVDDVGNQLQRIIRGCSQGSIETRVRYSETGERFVKFVVQNFGLQKLSNLHDKHLEKYAVFLKESGLSGKYIKTELSALRYIHRQLGDHARYELMDPLEFNKKLKLESTPDGRADRAWTEEEVSTMKQIAWRERKPEIARAIEASRSTGMRLNEMASLRRHQVEAALRSGVLHLTNTKGGRPRDIPLSVRARTILADSIKNIPRGEYVFCPPGKKVHEFKKEVQLFLINHRQKIQETNRRPTGHNLRDQDGWHRGALTFHGLRHAYARDVYQNTLNEGGSKEEAMQKVANFLGHGRSEVSSIYVLEKDSD